MTDPRADNHALDDLAAIGILCGVGGAVWLIFNAALWALS